VATANDRLTSAQALPRGSAQRGCERRNSAQDHSRGRDGGRADHKKLTLTQVSRLRQYPRKVTPRLRPPSKPARRASSPCRHRSNRTDQRFVDASPRSPDENGGPRAKARWPPSFSATRRVDLLIAPSCKTQRCAQPIATVELEVQLRLPPRRIGHVVHQLLQIVEVEQPQIDGNVRDLQG
jgi:hypothetical protein